MPLRPSIKYQSVTKEFNVSHSTVNRVINSFYEIQKPNYNYLPKHLCFDEFKSVKSASRAMSFVFCDADSYWKLILKERSKLDIKNYQHFHCFIGLMCQEDVVNYLLEQNIELRDTYEVYQDLLHCIKNKKIDQFNYILDNVEKNYPNISSYMKTSIKTLRENKSYIINTLITNYTNGVIEGIINKIKVIKRIAFGYRSFYHFKLRILIFNRINFKKKGLSITA